MTEASATAVNGSGRGHVVGLDQPPAGVPDATTWSALRLVLSSNGQPLPNIDNTVRVLEGHRALRDRLWLEEFSGRVLSTWNPDGEPAEWTDADDLRLTLWLQRVVGMGKITPATVHAAVTVVAQAHRRNAVQEWVRGLRWDRRKRLHLLLPRGFGAAASPYTEAVGRCFLVGMVARILRPGSKVDTMPVLEGPQGIRKSTGLQVLAGDALFAEAAESVTSKDFFTGLQGKALIEIAELDTFSRAEVTAVKRVLTCRVDRYRAPYGRRAEDHPRTCVFAGTTNRDDWNRDETGARRFWPVACTAVDLDWIRDHRDQLFAEAVHRFDAGEPWWDVPAGDAKREQDARREVDEWQVPIERYLVGKSEVQVAAVLEHGLEIRPEHWNRAQQMRVANVLKGLGWTRSEAWRSGKVRLWTRPAQEGGDGGDA